MQLTRTSLLLAVTAAVFAQPAQAAPRVGVMTVRVTQPGIVSKPTLANLNSLLWQVISKAPGIEAVPESIVASSLGGAASALTACRSDACMAQMGTGAGLDRIVYAVASPHAGGFALYVRSISVNPFAVLAEATPTCAPCGEAELFPLLSSLDLGAMAGGTALGAGQRPGQITLSSRPSGARATVSGRVLGHTPLSGVELPPGDHVITLLLAGFEPKEVAVSVKPGARLKKKVTLSKVPPNVGKLSITSTPSGAVVSLGRQPLGATPIKNMDIYPGQHVLRLDLAGYEPQDVAVDIPRGGKVSKKVKLKRSSSGIGKLTLSSTPPGATVRLGAQVLGVTPLESVEVYQGDHVLALELVGYMPMEVRVTVVSDKAVEKKVTLDKIPATTGMLSLSSTPTDAAVAMQGRPLGRTPIEGLELPPGAHRITLQADGFLPQDITVFVTVGKTVRQKVELKKIPATTGVLVVDTTPPGAVVASGGRSWGLTPLSAAQVPPGEYPLVISLTGFMEEKVAARVIAGKDTKIRLKLRALSRLKVTATSAGRPVPAKISLDGRPVGDSPVVVPDLPPGDHEVSATAPGLKALVKKIRLKPGVETTVTFELQAPMGLLTLRSKPPGAEVLDGRASLGRTPLKRAKVLVGARSVLVRKEGYRDQVVQVQVDDGAESTHSVVLEELPSTLVLSTTAGGRPLAGTPVKLDGKPVGSTPLTMTTVPAGKHTVEFAREGLVPVKKSITLAPGAKVEMSVALKVPAGKLTLTTRPSGAAVLLGRQPLGKTPLKAFAMAAGTHKLTLRADGYIGQDLEVTIVHRKTTKHAVKLEPNPPVLRVQTTPPGAEVLVDGKVVGKTPLRTTEVAPGAHTIEIKSAGYRDVKRSERLAVRETTDISETLVAREGTLKVASVPQGATVVVDGKSVGVTPLAGVAVLEGERTVELRLANYQPYTRKVMVSEGAMASMSVTLIPRPGRISVSSTPAGATVLLDGKSSGVTPVTLESIPVGHHTVRLTLADHDPVRQAAQVAPGATVTLSFSLKRSAAAVSAAALADARRARQWYMIGAYTAAGLVAAGGIVFMVADNSKRNEVHSSVDVYNRFIQRDDELLDPEIEQQLAQDISDADLDLRSRPDRALGVTFLGVAAAAAGLGTYFLLVEATVDDVPTASIAPTAGGAGLVLTGRF